MKSISEIANELNMSRQNVYACVKAAGIDIDTLDKKKQGKQVLFSADAVEQIVSACQNSRARHVKKGDASDDSLTQIQELQDKIASLTDELTRTQEQLTAAQQEIARLRAIEDEQRHTISSQAAGEDRSYCAVTALYQRQREITRYSIKSDVLRKSIKSA